MVLSYVARVSQDLLGPCIRASPKAQDLKRDAQDQLDELGILAIPLRRTVFPCACGASSVILLLSAQSAMDQCEPRADQ